MAKSKTHDLTDKEVFFGKEYLKDLNGTQAAIRAGYSESSAAEIAYENLRKPHIQDYINELKEKRSKRLEIDSDKIIAELAKIAFCDIRKVYGTDGQLLPIQSIDDDSAGAIAGLKSYEEKLQTTDAEGEQIIQGTNKEVKLYDKIKALELLGKHIGFFEKDNEQLKPVVNNVLPENDLKTILAEINKANGVS